jgi:cytochrome b
MDKSQWITAILVGLFVVAIAVYRLLWTGSSAAAAARLRRFPRSPRKLFQWFLGQRTSPPSDAQPKAGSSPQINP